MLALFWAAYAKVYDFIWDSPLTTVVRGALQADLPSPGAAVDLGCGTGLSSLGLHAQGWEVIGVDSSAAMLERAISRARITTALRCPDASATGLTEYSFQLVVLSNLLHLHPNPLQVLDEAWRLTAPNGRIVVVWPSAGATLSTAFHADLQAHRKLHAAVIAATLRLAVGLAGVLAGARQHSGESVAATLTTWAGRTGAQLCASGTAFKTQTYAIYNRTPG